MKGEVDDRVAVVTGASAGIGKATAESFVRMGWHVIGVGRDPERSAAAEAELRAAAREDGRVDFLRGDFCEMSDVKRIADGIKKRTNRIDTLVNNAGGVRDKLYRSSEGMEATFAANHLSAFLLTRELMPLLESTVKERAPGSVRVLAVSSDAHEYCQSMHWADLNRLEDFTAGEAYCQAKLANILFTRDLDRRVAPNGIIAQCMHPGVIASNFANHGDESMRTRMNSLDRHPPEFAAETLVWMATAPEAGVDGGRYFHDLEEIPPAPQALDDEAAARLWHQSEEILANLGY